MSDNEGYWRYRCGVELGGGARCFQRVVPGRRCFLHRQARPVEAPEPPRSMCTAVCKSGEPCRARALKGGEYCGYHQAYRKRAPSDLVAENIELRRQITHLTLELDRAKAAAEFWRKHLEQHADERVNGDARL